MSDSRRLEQRYRRLLICYPRAFRREHEDEMLAVLMAGAEPGRDRARPGDALDLIGNAIWMRVRPRVPRSQAAVFWAIVLIYVCAALRLLGIAILPTARGHAAYPLDIGISWAVFAVLAWVAGRRHNWARVLFACWVGLHSFALLADIAHGVGTTVPSRAVIASLAFWLIELSAVALLLSRPSRRFYGQRPVHS